jgi:3-dehydroquinate synthetase
VGFLASVYLRGVKLVQVPTTWLSVVDSAIGGKTALNFMGSKNQIGTVYPPKSVLIFMDLLQTADFKMSEGEIIKTLVLNHKRSWAREVLLKKHLKSPDQELLKRLLTFKKMIVKKDPNDTNGVRALLNLGHSSGHAFESILGLSHSDAVKAGLKFSLEWSRKKRLINSRTFDELTGFLKEPLPLVSREDMLRELSNDKKSLFGGKLNFIFIDENGGIVKPVQIKSVVNEYQRQLQNGL